MTQRHTVLGGHQFRQPREVFDRRPWADRLRQRSRHAVAPATQLRIGRMNFVTALPALAAILTAKNGTLPAGRLHTDRSQDAILHRSPTTTWNRRLIGNLLKRRLQHHPPNTLLNHADVLLNLGCRPRDFPFPPINSHANLDQQGMPSFDSRSSLLRLH